MPPGSLPITKVVSTLFVTPFSGVCHSNCRGPKTDKISQVRFLLAYSFAGVHDHGKQMVPMPFSTRKSLVCCIYPIRLASRSLPPTSTIVLGLSVPMPNLLATFMGLPKPLLHIICLTVVSLRMSEVSAITGDSWCGTLMCVKATVNDSVVTCKLTVEVSRLTTF